MTKCWLVCLAPLVAACTSGDGTPLYPLPGSADVETQATYPEPPYGVIKGQVIENFDFEGFVNARADSADDAIVPIALGDFFNQTGEDVYPAESPFAEGEPKPRLLFLNLSAVWCGPCQEEAANVFPGRYAELKPLGAEFLVVLSDAVEMGQPASVQDLQNWTGTFDIDYPCVLDPERHLPNVFDTSAYPANMLVDTQTMTILEIVTGIPGDSFWDLARSSLET